MTVFYIIHNDELIRLETGAALGSGGEGAVYPILQPSQWRGFCVKEYIDRYKNAEKEAKLQFMIDNPPAQLDSPQGKLCWPVTIAYDAGFSEFVGFVMPLAYSDSQQLYLLSNLNNRRLEGAWQNYFDQSSDSFDKRLEIGVNLCAVITLMYQSDNYTIVDFKPENIMFTVDGKVALVDMDSIQIRADEQGLPHYGRVNTIGYTPPEGTKITVRNTLVDTTWDEFSLAVILYQILFGIHPYMATFRPPHDRLNSLGDKIQQNLFVHGESRLYVSALPPLHDRFKKLPRDIQALFKISFDNNTKERTSAVLWQETLSQYLAKQTFKPLRNLTTISSNIKPLVPPKPISALAGTINEFTASLPSLLSTTIKRFGHYNLRPKSTTPNPAPSNKSNANSQKTTSNKAAKPPRSKSSAHNNKTSNYKKRSYVNDTPPHKTTKKSANTLLNFNQPHLIPSHLLPSNLASGQSSTKNQQLQRIGTGKNKGFFNLLVKRAEQYPTLSTLLGACLLFALFATFVFYTSNEEQNTYSSFYQTVSVAPELPSNEIMDKKDNFYEGFVSNNELGNIYSASNPPTPYETLERFQQRQQQSIAQSSSSEIESNIASARFAIAPKVTLTHSLRQHLEPNKIYRVGIRIQVTPTGIVDNVEIANSSGNKALDDHALTDFRSVVFKPFIQDGDPVEAQLNVNAIYDTTY